MIYVSTTRSSGRITRTSAPKTTGCKFTLTPLLRPLIFLYLAATHNSAATEPGARAFLFKHRSRYLAEPVRTCTTRVRVGVRVRTDIRRSAPAVESAAIARSSVARECECILARVCIRQLVINRRRFGEYIDAWEKQGTATG